MKKLNLLIIFAMILFSCTTEEDATIQPDSTSRNSKAVSIGEEHNLGLEYVYQELLAAKAGGALDMSDFNAVFEASEKSTNDFLLASSFNTNDDITLAESAISFSGVQNGTLTSDTVLWSPSIDARLTNLQKDLFNELNDALEDGTTGLAETLSVFESVRQRCLNDCSAQEQVAVLYAIDIGTSSLEYWDANTDKWIDLFGSRSVRGWFSWKKLGKADVAGAAAGAVGGAISGGGAGAGPGALAGGIAGSVGNAVGQIWDRIFG
jgi:hypothetical protein